MSAQEEFNALVNNNRDKFTSHPEDHDDLHFSDEDDSGSDAIPRNLRQRHTVDSSDEDEDFDDNMVSSTNYQIPKNTFEANTGPKGVIADAQAFERARKKSFRRTLLNAAGFDQNGPAFGSAKPEPPAPVTDGSSGSEDEEERFLRKWRASRMQALQNRAARRPSPRGRHYGQVDIVDAAGYLDAIEKVTSGTVVVVCIFDPKSDESAIVEECLNTIARRQSTTRFVKLHHEIAEMDHIQAPALLAYRAGDVFATITDIIRNIPRGRPCSADSLEDLLKLNRVF
ncbi:uncharacterized protein N7484_009464 [Penicillium longicatenatum]|uniref:uncharacterized protein n=1 Tax=Penicillium longicatenatum TaxID=1561947 RepID=UPI0025498DD2|nr:uncharacterized protein N7484_009464 [Penicillium longicatenatum]KAJ5636151.1 hypothetical protein N7484_009464 [Penicillium longicatenatum]KAJ5656343.1 hypothetical protein N7507_008293 [Penicillium longicatenatum]